MNSDNYIRTNKTPGLHSKTGSEEQLGITQAFLGTWFLPFLSLSEELPGKLTCFPLVSTFTFICIGCFFTLVDEWPFPYSLLTYTGFRKYGFILVSSKTEFLFLFCSHFWADFKVDNRQKDFFFFCHFVPGNEISLVWDDNASFSLWIVQTQTQGCNINPGGEEHSTWE